MPAKNHPDYNEELNRLNYTLDYVDKSIIAMTKRQKKVEEDLLGSRKSLNVDSSQAYIDLMLNSMFEESIKIKLKKLIDAQSKPYFARIDFKEKDKEQIEKIYIGKVSLMKEENQELVIVDWRAPIANLYYEERLGEASYLCPDGKIIGNLSLKRQFSIEKGILNEIFDIDITTNDEFLQTYLGANADNRLKDIVSTIQAEQNRIIRADMWKPLIVQGAAGSGKTTIALHRIAYLIYTYEKSFVPENFMIIAPNRLFLNYISEVLPELGVDKVKQTTFEDFAMELIGKKYRLTDANEKLTNFVNNNATSVEIEKNKLVEVESKFKASMMFKEILDEYIKDIEKNFIPEEDFKIGKIVILKYEDINHLFLNEYKDLPMSKRILEIKKHLINRLKYKKESILSYIESECEKRVKFLKTKMEDGEERREKIGKIIDRKYELISKLDNLSKKAVNDYVKKISKIDPYEYYYNLISDKDLFYKYTNSKIEDKYQKFIREYSLEILDSKQVEIEDLAPIIYLKYCIHGIDDKIPVKHIVIDEAQDFSLFQIYVIKKIIKDSSFTILGDLSQGIHSYRGTKNWEDIRNFVFTEVKSELLTLEQSYRTTVEIMDAANKVISNLKDENLVPAKPVIRHGEKVNLIKKDNLKTSIEDINNKIKYLKTKGYKTFAIICKTLDECKTVFNSIKKEDYNPYIITGKEKEYKTGVIVVPSYLSKGLEFDVVFISDGSKEKYTTEELDIKLLYVAMTRPLHKLYIYYSNELSPLLEGV